MGYVLVQCAAAAPTRRVKRVAGKSGYRSGDMDEMEVALKPENLSDSFQKSSEFRLGFRTRRPLLLGFRIFACSKSSDCLDSSISEG